MSEVANFDAAVVDVDVFDLTAFSVDADTNR
jgi:hypothetical protein